jgi:hypothetical protein
MPESVHVEVTPSADDPGSHDQDRIAALETRLQAAETRESPAPDLSPIHEAIAGLTSKFDAILDRLSNPPEAKAESKVDTDDEETEDAPKVVTQMATKAEVTERPPRASHILFRRFGGR